MNQMTIDLRAAAASARAFADGSNSAELKRSFYAMARRWEAEAELHDSELAQDQELPRTGCQMSRRMPGITTSFRSDG
jgi:hypothetical protein